MRLFDVHVYFVVDLFQHITFNVLIEVFPNDGKFKKKKDLVKLKILKIESYVINCVNSKI